MEVIFSAIAGAVSGALVSGLISSITSLKISRRNERINRIREIIDNIKHISKAIISLKNTFTKPQIVTVVQELENVVNSKLPDQKNIKHSGYVILCKINIALISKNISHQTYWNDLLLKANEISNTSDKILIFEPSKLEE